MAAKSNSKAKGGKRKALCVGINDYPYAGNDLNGCVNDAKAWAEMLTKNFNFPTSDVKLLLDSQATKKGTLDALKKLVTGAAAGDHLVFTNSSHGSYVADTSGDEERYDEIVCPHDIDANEIVALPSGEASTLRRRAFTGACTAIIAPPSRGSSA